MTVIRILRDIFAVVVAVATLLHCAAAKRTFVVGGNLGWTVPPKPNAYAIWASNHTFAVDDILLFHFEEGKHTVAKVSKEAYEACNTSITPFFIRRQSTAFVSLDTTGVKFFIDTVGDNCLKGQKVAVDVTIPAHSPTQPPPSTPSPPPPPPSNGPPSSPATPPSSPPPSSPSNSPPPSPATPPASPPPSPPSNSPPSSPATPPASSPPTPPSNNPPASPATPPASSPPSPPSNNPPSSPATPPGTPVSPPSPVTPGPAVPPSSSSSPPPPTTQTAPPPPPNAATTAGVPIGIVFMSISLGYLIWN